MNREDKRDEALGAVLRKNAEYAAREAAAKAVLRTPEKPGRGNPATHAFRSGKVFRIAGIAVAAAAAVIMAVQPVLARRAETRAQIRQAARDLSIRMIRMDAALPEEPPVLTEAEAAAADFAEALWAQGLEL